MYLEILYLMMKTSQYNRMLIKNRMPTTTTIITTTTIAIFMMTKIGTATHKTS